MAACGIETEQPSAGVTIVDVRGECTAHDAAQLRSALARAVRRGGRIVVDLTGAEAMDATALHVLLDMQRDAADSGIDVVAVLREDAALTARTSVDLAAVPTAMPTFPTRDQALAGD